MDVNQYRDSITKGIMRFKNQGFRKTNTLKENRDIILKFDDENKAQGLKDRTRGNYMTALYNFAEWLENKKFQDVIKEDIISYINHLKSKVTITKNTRKEGLKSSSIDFVKMRLKRFYLWLNNDEEYPECVDWIEFKKSYKKLFPEDILSEEEIKKMIKSAGSLRNRAIISVLYESGLRVSEFLSIRLEDVVPDEYGVKVRVDGKTGKRIIRLVNSVPDLEEWLRIHPSKSDTSAYLWTRSNRISTQLHYSGLYGILIFIAKKARIVDSNGKAKKIFPHLFRHSRASFLASKIPESHLRNFMGWTEDSNMIKTYVHLSSDKIDEVVLSKVYGQRTEKMEEMIDKLAPKVCFNCGERNPQEYEFCLNCKWPLNVDAIKAKERQFLMLLTPEIIQKLIEKKVDDALMKRFA